MGRSRRFIRVALPEITNRDRRLLDLPPFKLHLVCERLRARAYGLLQAGANEMQSDTVFDA